IVGIARAGLFPATQVALYLRREMYPARVTRRFNDEVVYGSPVWRVPVSAEVAGKVVGVVDEMADTGETLAMVAEAVLAAGATGVITASLVAHSWAAPMPDIVGMETDAFVLFPWDREVLADGTWGPHPEVTLGMQEQAQQQQ
ncbi:MAG: phosphoribosyltransferase, partial [Tepidiformaceae bacterium]